MLTLEQAIAIRRLKPKKPGPFKITQATIDACHKPRKTPWDGGYTFPAGFGCSGADWPMVTTIDDEGTPTTIYQGDPIASKEQIDTYVREFCALNHLKG